MNLCPLLDRIDMKIELFPIKKEIYLTENNQSESSESMQKKVLHVRKIQEERYKEEMICYNSQLSPNLIKRYCKLDSGAKKILTEALQKLSLSGRSYYKIIKVAQTISDFEESSFIEELHMAESIRYHCAEKYFG
ncbi:MAG: hypothetical protein VB095_06300 [Anaerovorax sp.]|nr:hypothetical protein [Anaerovorax sp.]